MGARCCSYWRSRAPLLYVLTTAFWPQTQQHKAGVRRNSKIAVSARFQIWHPANTRDGVARQDINTLPLCYIDHCIMVNTPWKRVPVLTTVRSLRLSTRRLSLSSTRRALVTSRVRTSVTCSVPWARTPPRPRSPSSPATPRRRVRILHAPRLCADACPSLGALAVDFQTFLQILNRPNGFKPAGTPGTSNHARRCG